MFFRWRKGGPEPAQGGGSSHPEQLLVDAHSGLYQSWYFERRVREEAARCARCGHGFALMVFEPRLLPGELLTDDVVSEAAEVIRSGIRKIDLAGRLDRNRFAALLIEAGYGVARSANHRLKADLGQKARTGSVPWRGAFAVFPNDGLDFDVLLEVAGRRLNDDMRAAA